MAIPAALGVLPVAGAIGVPLALYLVSRATGPRRDLEPAVDDAKASLERLLKQAEASTAERRPEGAHHRARTSAPSRWPRVSSSSSTTRRARSSSRASIPSAARYPGQIKVTVIRETRAVDYAR